MRYAETVALKGGAELLVRNAVASDARALRETMRRTHSETDYLLSYPDEQNADEEQGARLLEGTEHRGRARRHDRRADRGNRGSHSGGRQAQGEAPGAIRDQRAEGALGDGDRPGADGGVH